MIRDKRLPIKKQYLLYLEEVPKHKFACKAVKISEDSGKRWRDEDKDFADLCETRIVVFLNMFFIFLYELIVLKIYRQPRRFVN